MIKVRLRGPSFQIANVRRAQVGEIVVGHVHFCRPHHRWVGARGAYSFVPTAAGERLGLKHAYASMVRLVIESATRALTEKEATP